MASSKLEVLVDFGDSPDKQQVDKTIKELTSREGVKEAQFKDGAIMVETSLPSTEILEFVTKTSGRRAVLQGFGDGQSAVAMVSGQSCCGGTVVGVVRFQQTGDVLVADGSIDGLPPSSEHGLHIHSTGDLSEGCNSIGDHYNPLGSPHGGPQDSADRRHAGDLGNIRVGDNGRATFRITDRILKVWDIIGRSVAVSEKEDDLGRGSSPSSIVNGDSGKAIACGVIARSAGIFQNPKRICACDGIVVWDERDRPLAGKGRREAKKCCQNHSSPKGENIRENHHVNGENGIDEGRELKASCKV
ncbi:unnamed protein product [Chilo suppressalis]|uniref:superoxide dismutase n=1 Tax=Chilo suppressalis TaxID=168631 RepID=A0ABN8EEB7_CHISP|nr:unnamed protein product [Chilo suppressalis]